MRKWFSPADRVLIGILIVITLPLGISVLTNAALTWDGAWYLFQMVDTREPFVPHNRLIVSSLHTPLIWSMSVTDNLAILRAIFGITHVITPLVTLLASWWIIRDRVPQLIIWPMIAIGLFLLPGHINFISEAIKAYMLMWPLLLAVLVGLPPRTIAPVSMIALVIMYLHPAAIPIFVATSAAGLTMAYFNREARHRLLPFSSSLLIAAGLRYTMVTNHYESDAMNWQTIDRQFHESTTELVWVMLSLAIIAGILLLLCVNSQRVSRHVETAVLVCIAIGGGAMTIWAADASAWWRGLEFRGPALIFTMLTAFAAFIDAISHQRTPTLTIPPMRLSASRAIAVAFAIVLSVQSITWNRELNHMRSAMAESDRACIVAENLPGFEHSPLNFWPLPATSIMIQSVTPEYVVLPQDLCANAERTGEIPMNLNDPLTDTPGRWVNMYYLRSRVTAYTTCWFGYEQGWHELETGGETRIWTKGTNGSLIVVMDNAGPVQLSGTLDSLEIPNEVQIRVNGLVQRTIPLEETRYRDLAGIQLHLDQGENTIEFVSMRPASHAPGDSRLLGIAVINLELTAIESDAICTWRH